MPSDPSPPASTSRRRYLALAGAAVGASVGTAGCGGVAARVRAPRVEWRTEIGSQWRVASVPDRTDGRILAIGGSELVAVDADSGDRLWESSYFERPYGPVVADGVAIVGERRRAGYRPNGAELWSRETEHRFIPRAALDGAVVGGCDRADAVVLAVDATDGGVRWGVTPDGWPRYGGAFDAVTVADGLVAAHFEGPLTGIDPDGAIRWVTDDEWDTHGPGNPSLASSGSTVVAASGAIAGFDAATGDRRWRRVLPDLATGVAAADGTAYVTVEGDTPKVDSWDEPGGVVAYDATDGMQLWRAVLPDPARPPAAGSDGIVVGTDEGDLFALDAEDGSVRWRRPVGDRVVTAPLITLDRVFVGAATESGAATVVALPR